MAKVVGAHKTKVTLRAKNFVAAFCLVAFSALASSASLLHPQLANAAAPSSPPSQICGNASVLTGPVTAPNGAVTVPTGNNSSLLGSLQPNTTYYFASGTHTLGMGSFNQIAAEANDTFIGAPGAILDGQGSNQFSFIGNSPSVTNVTIEYLTIQNFRTPGSEGAVNQNANSNWTIKYDTIQNNLPGAGMMIGSNDVIQNNCLTKNGEYAFNAYEAPDDAAVSSLTHGPKNINISNNEISYNNTCNWEAVSNFPVAQPSGCNGAGQGDGCGCSGGGKFWAVDGATYDSNYVHDNYSVGMWADTNNTGFDVEGNYFANNYGEGIIYEISYNALFKDNTFIKNANASGPSNPGFPDSALYISESGGDSRVPGFSSGSLSVTGNVFTDNYGGVVLWENANRYCSSDANTSTGDCTIVNPTVANINTCASASNIAKTPYINDCRWKTQNVTVKNNTFNFTPANVGSSCTVSNGCGFNGLFSEYGTYEPYTAWVVPTNVSNNQNNTFSNNTYNGPWNFMGFQQGDSVSWSEWHGGFTDENGSDVHFNGQDAGSTFNTVTTPTNPPSVPGNVTATANSPTSVTVDWSASTDVNGPGLGGYYVLRNGTQVAAVGASTHSYTDTAVSANTQYTYTVEAYDMANPANVSAPSSPAVVTTPQSTGGTTQSAIVGIAGKCVDANGSVVRLYHCNQAGAQQWSLTTAGTIVNQNGSCLAPSGGATTPKTLVVLTSCNGSSAQVWSVNAATHAIVNTHSGLCLDDKHSGTADGNPIWIYRCNQTAAQQWTTTWPQGSAGTGSQSPFGPIVGIGSKCIDNYHSQLVNGNPIQLYHCNQTGAQQWSVTSTGAITNASKYCLAPAGGGTALQTLVVLAKCNGSSAQAWNVNTTTKVIVNVQSGLCLEDKQSGTADGNPLWLYTCDQTSAEQWTMASL